jgi:hypothetical protein
VLLTGCGGAFPENVKNQGSAPRVGGKRKSAGKNVVNGQELAGHTGMLGT